MSFLAVIDFCLTQEFTLAPLEEFTTFNRQRELDRMARERKEQEWEHELLSAMEASGSPLSSTSTSTPRLTEDQDEDTEVGPCTSSSVSKTSTADSKKLAWYINPILILKQLIFHSS